MNKTQLDVPTMDRASDEPLVPMALETVPRGVLQSWGIRQRWPVANRQAGGKSPAPVGIHAKQQLWRPDRWESNNA